MKIAIYFVSGFMKGGYPLDKNFIEKNLESNDSLVRILYSDLQERINIYETDGSAAAKIKLVDAIPSVAIVGCFGLYLLTLFI